MKSTLLVELLDYLCNSFLIAFVMCLIGALLRELMISMHDTNNIRLKKICVSTIFSSFLVSAASGWIKDALPFAGYIFCCLMAGIWGYQLFSLATNVNVVTTFIKNLFKQISTPLSEAAKETADDLEKKYTDDEDISDNEESTTINKDK